MLWPSLVLLAAVARSADGIPIHFTDDGRGDPAVVFVHCWRCDLHFWDAQVSWLSKERRVVAIDLAGHGESGGGRRDWTVEAFGRDVAAVVESLGLKRLILVGSSMGGQISLEAMRVLGDRVVGLVPVDTLKDVAAKTPPDQIDGFLKQLTDDYRGAATQFMDRYLFAASTPPAVRERVRAGAFSGSAADSVAMLRNVMLYDPVPALRNVRVPIRAINSDISPTNVEGNRRVVPQFDAAIIGGVGHYPMLEAPARFNALLADAIREISK